MQIKTRLQKIRLGRIKTAIRDLRLRSTILRLKRFPVSNGVEKRSVLLDGYYFVPSEAIWLRCLAIALFSRNDIIHKIGQAQSVLG